jgi:hypothetical protein
MTNGGWFGMCERGIWICFGVRWDRRIWTMGTGAVGAEGRHPVLFAHARRILRNLYPESPTQEGCSPSICLRMDGPAPTTEGPTLEHIHALETIGITTTNTGDYLAGNAANSFHHNPPPPHRPLWYSAIKNGPRSSPPIVPGQPRPPSPGARIDEVLDVGIRAAGGPVYWPKD